PLGRRQRLAGDRCTGEGDVPAIGLTADGDRLDRAPQRAGPADREASTLAQDEIAVVESGAVAILLVAEGMVAGAPLATRGARLLTRSQSAEERLIGPVAADEHILQHVAMTRGLLRKGSPQFLQLGFLLETRRALALAPAPPSAPLLQRAVVEQTTAPPHLLQ